MRKYQKNCCDDCRQGEYNDKLTRLLEDKNTCRTSRIDPMAKLVTMDNSIVLDLYKITILTNLQNMNSLAKRRMQREFMDYRK